LRVIAIRQKIVFVFLQSNFLFYVFPIKNLDRSRREIYANVEANSNSFGLDGKIDNEINKI